MLLALAAVLVAAGCSGLPWFGEGSGYGTIPAGSVIRLNRAVEVPAYHARVWIQGGAIVGTRFDAYAPSCGIEVSRIDRDAPQYVQPGDFRVTRVQFVREEVVRFDGARVAAAGVPVSERPEGGGDPLFHEGFHLWVKNPEQPNVRRFTCRGIYGLAFATRPPTVAEIRAAFGDIATLILATE